MFHHIQIPSTGSVSLILTDCATNPINVTPLITLPGVIVTTILLAFCVDVELLRSNIFQRFVADTSIHHVGLVAGGLLLFDACNDSYILCTFGVVISLYHRDYK